MSSVRPMALAHGASYGAQAAIPARAPSSCPPSSRVTRSSPSLTSFPDVDDHLVRPEVTRDEMVNGKKVVAMPAAFPHAAHADQHFQLDFVIRAHVKEGYIGASDLITRVDIGSDFATDVCIRKAGIDPATGKRYLEEFAFEIVNDQSIGEVRERIENLARRGVRRVFGVFVRDARVAEWSREAHDFVTLPIESLIEDECLLRPFRVRAILEAAEADNAVARALVDKGNPVLTDLVEQSKAQGRAEGKAEGMAQGIARGKVDATRDMLLHVIARLGFAISAGARARIEACSDEGTLRAWMDEALGSAGAPPAWLTAC